MRLDEDQNVAGNAGGCVVVREGRLQSQIGFAPVPSPLHSEMTNKCALAYFSILQACNSAEDSISRRRGFESHRARQESSSESLSTHENVPLTAILQLRATTQDARLLETCRSTLQSCAKRSGICHNVLGNGKEFMEPRKSREGTFRASSNPPQRSRDLRVERESGLG
jgi:hypothetical protein